MIWMRHKKTGRYLTTLGWVTTLLFGTCGRIDGYASKSSAKGALRRAGWLNGEGIVWEDLEAIEEDQL